MAQPLTLHAIEEESAAEAAASEPEVDIRARFEEFQRDFAEEFGVRSGPDPTEALAERVGKALEERWSDSGAFRLYRRLEDVYSRFEGFYKRIEKSTRWATGDYSVEPDLEAAVDGKVRLRVERELGPLDMGLDVDDAIGGKLGLRLGGTLRNYKFSFDANDIVNNGRLSFQLRKIPK